MRVSPADEAQLHDELQSAVQNRVRLILREAGDNSYSEILTMLLRLRQIACDPSLVPDSFIEVCRSV